MSALAHELDVASRLVRRAGAIVAELQDAGLEVERKAEDEPVTEADRRASALLVEGLRTAFPRDGILSEEAADDGSRLRSPRVWMIDPIDGTSDFIRGEDGYSVMVGLLEGDVPVLGLVYQPRGDRLYRAVSGEGAFVEAHGTRRIEVSSVDRLELLRMVASKSHRDETITRIKVQLGISDEQAVGSVGLKLGLIARGDRDVYVNLSGRTKHWDTLGPQVILHEAGGRLTDARGAAIDYRASSIVNHTGIVATNGVSHDAVLRKIAPIVASLS
jgi:3'(2'), 5'-bisphosphate nucleotidase